MRSGILDIYPRIPLFTALLLFTITFFVYSDFGIRMIFGYAVMVYIVLMYLIFRNNNIRLTRIKTLYLILAAVLCILPLMGGGGSSSGVFAISVAVCALVAFAGDIRRRELKAAIIVLAVFSVIIALYVVAVRIYPPLYTSVTRKYLSAESQTMNDLLLLGGYGISLGGNVVFIDYVLSMCGLLLFNIIMAYKGALKHKLLYWGCIGVGAVGMLFVNRKSEILAYAIAVLFCYIMQMQLSTRQERKKIIRVTVILVALGIAALFVLGAAGYLRRYVVFVQRLVGYLMGTEGMDDVSSGRNLLWEIAITQFVRHPIFGIGWGHFHDYLPYELSHLDNVHNNYIQLLCETGVVGFLLVMVPMVLIFTETIRRVRVNCRRTNREPLLLALNITSYGLQISFFVMSFLDPCLYKMSFWPFFAIAVMMGDCTEKAMLEKKE